MQDVWQLMQQQSWFFLLTVGLVSLCIGSFLNVVIYRLPKMMETEWKKECRVILGDESNSQQASKSTFNLITPRSTCPSCNTQIKAHHNIPVLSWLLLKGRCAYCEAVISIRYPLIEMLTAGTSLWVAWHFGATLQALLYIVLTWALIALIFIDIDKMLLPDQITLPLLWLALLAAATSITISPADAIIGAAVGYLSLWSVYWAFKLLTGKEGMGFGDFKLLAIFGALLGWQSIITIVLLSSLVGAIIGSAQLTVQGKDKATPIPFGPYLAIAGWLTLFYGSALKDWYLNFLGV
ncbi:prepilin peptidase [Pseudoalteromonas luteoviolacea]|uniref:Prepilin leader peptidase/N-methyltransferase n=1 Tax=Pseudoalteromonas luteoviolacea DSM 6061 TaxID=1365250 RepID=A0A167CEV8_9GAMM|nr:A24 family peptidase [Pseudoalteromonas luteoviolacea]KZN47578.1 N-methyltransferase [Pseudoalteromonas luteoviolacea DSM 6061]MBE0388524.1 leader peptidase (prepilin peptidase) / N-methyltransferase [Pseudoalteromonas luteoviolacea DSM 6061]